MPFTFKMWSIFKVDFLPKFCMKNRPLETIKRLGFEKKQSSFSILCACAFLQELFYSKRSNEAEWWRKGSPLSWYKKLLYCSILKPIFSTLKPDLEFECIFNGFSSKKTSVMMSKNARAVHASRNSCPVDIFDDKKRVLRKQKSLGIGKVSRSKNGKLFKDWSVKYDNFDIFQIL